MRDPMPQSVRLEDYTAPQFLIDSVDLDFTIEEEFTLVRACLAMRRNTAAGDASSRGAPAPCVLDGEDLGFVSVAIDDRVLDFEFQFHRHGFLEPGAESCGIFKQFVIN